MPSLAFYAIALALALGRGAHGERISDPYASISIHTLANGMTVVLAPSGNARNIEIEIRVNTGWNAEDSSNLGVAHLVEHALFRDERLGADQSYLQLIKEKASGQANGITGWKTTSFYASVPSLKGIWALNEFSRMLLSRTFTAADLQKSASEILLEMGEPNNFFQSLFSHLNPANWQQPDFFESEFGITSKNAAEEEIRKRTTRLTVAQAQEFYERYYAPGNMVLFYAGPFKPKETLEFVKETFETYPERPFEELEDPQPKPRQNPYLRSRFASRDSWISIGTKYWDIAPEDELTLKLYFEYLAHRLMKKLRNENGETYSVEPKVWVDELRYGYAVVSFETRRENFEKNLTYLEDLIQRETQQDGLTDEAIQQARELMRNELALLDNSAEVMAKLADRLYTFHKTYQTAATPYEVFQRLSNAEIRERLKILFQPERRYRSLIEPPLLFRGEHIAFAIFMAVTAFFAFRLFLERPFDHTAVRYVRKIKYRPALLFALAILYFNTLWLMCQVGSFIDRQLLYWNFFQSSYLLTQYGEGAFFILALVAVTLGFLCFLPRKLIVADNHLILKSITYYARRFPRSAIRGVTLCRPYQLVTRKLWRPTLRLLHWAIWKKGILLELKSGDTYYLGFRDADRVIDELEEVLGEKTVTDHTLSPSARSRS